jgi:manganese/zinc/iron transport system permease protein
MESLLRFLSLADPNVRYVVTGSVLIAAAAAVAGSFTLLRKRALIGDAIAHSVLPGVCLAFLLSGSKNPLYLVPGAILTGWLSIVAVDKITAHSKIKEDTAIGLVLSVFFGLGILLLTAIQHRGGAAQTGLDHFLFGKAASIVAGDLITFSVLAIAVLIAVVFLFKEFTLMAFDPEFARAIGLPVRRYELVLTTLTVLAVVVGIQAVGVVLMAAMLITPPAAARYWTDNLRVMVVLSALIGAASGLAGAYISYLAPAMPTGPWIVVVASTLAFISFFAAPGKGILFGAWRKRKFRHLIAEENILKSMYRVAERRGDSASVMAADQIRSDREMPARALASGLQRLRSQGFVQREGEDWQFTAAGREKGRRVVRLHRLWELYLTRYLRIAPDHVHDDAETIEHIITPEIEQRLERELDFPKVDPHDEQIPYN